MLTKKPPYATTGIPPEKTQFEITKMLKEFGCEAIRWTELKGELPVLEFSFEVEIRGVLKKVGVQVKPTRIMVKKGPTYDRKIVSNDAQSMRLLFWWLKSKLEAVMFGLESFEREFMSHVLFRLPSGETKQLGEEMERALAEGESPTMRLLGEE